MFYLMLLIRRWAVILAGSLVVVLVVASPIYAYPSVASWYGPGLHGNPDACGGTFNQWGYTTAHRTLPCGTPVTVCYQGCVGVSVQDRGPYVGGVEYDLSRGAADAVGLTHVGVDTVQAYPHKQPLLVAPSPEPAREPEPAPSAEVAADGSYVVQSGDTLTGIAAHLGVSVEHLIAVNGIEDPNVIYAGDVLYY